jgi:hypothetical protein
MSSSVKLLVLERVVVEVLVLCMSDGQVVLSEEEPQSDTLLPTLLLLLLFLLLLCSGLVKLISCCSSSIETTLMLSLRCFSQVCLIASSLDDTDLCCFFNHLRLIWNLLTPSSSSSRISFLEISTLGEEEENSRILMSEKEEEEAEAAAAMLLLQYGVQLMGAE